MENDGHRPLSMTGWIERLEVMFRVKYNITMICGINLHIIPLFVGMYHKTVDCPKTFDYFVSNIWRKYTMTGRWCISLRLLCHMLYVYMDWQRRYIQVRKLYHNLWFLSTIDKYIICTLEQLSWNKWVLSLAIIVCATYFCAFGSCYQEGTWVINIIQGNQRRLIKSICKRIRGMTASGADVV